MSEQKQVRVRFAPSPTGYLHVGGARTALFNWLFARHHYGVFVLRIEDTDRTRSSAAMTDAILEGLTWLGLDWDEGPLHQADGVQRHRDDALRLLHHTHAYRCFCTPEELDARRARHPGGAAAFRYDRRCLALSPAASAARADAGEPHTIRFRVPPGTTRWHDAVHGDVAFDNADIEDFIILRRDATPIYNMAVVSDDVAMRITHVIRGDDHISNTPKQILLYVALGAELPTFAHVPMILGPDGRRLSKRHGATAVGEYRQQGFLPEAMFNFLALLGWSPGTDEEILSRAELVARFSLDDVNRKSAIFDTTKLEWMNGRYLTATPSADLVVPLRAFIPDAAAPDDTAWWTRLVDLLKTRSRTLRDLAEQARTYVTDPVAYDPAAVARHWRDAGAVADRLSQLRDTVARVQRWDETTLEAALRALAEQLGVGAARLIHPWRVSLTGSAASPGIFDVAVLLGRERVLLRMDNAIAWLRRTEVSGVQELT
jgi:glutamyl-tRNA synthetase